MKRFFKNFNNVLLGCKGGSVGGTKDAENNVVSVQASQYAAPHTAVQDAIQNTGPVLTKKAKSKNKVSQAPLDVQWLDFWSRCLYAFAPILVLSGMVWYGVNHHFFDLRGVIVKGDLEHVSVDSMQAHVGPVVFGTLFTTDLETIARAVTAEPWVRQAVVTRMFPFYLQVQVQAQKPVARWNNEKDAELLNQYGEVFSANWAELSGLDLPHLVGPEEQATLVLQMYQNITLPLHESGLRPLQVQLSKRGSWQATLSNGAVLKIGRGDLPEVVQRVVNFSKTFSRIKTAQRTQGSAQLKSADLRYPNGYAIELQEVSTSTFAASNLSKS